jgi:hypothetical protein
VQIEQTNRPASSEFDNSCFIGSESAIDLLSCLLSASSGAQQERKIVIRKGKQKQKQKGGAARLFLSLSLFAQLLMLVRISLSLSSIANIIPCPAAK